MANKSKLQERLEQLAKKFKETKLWEVLSDADVFAVRLEDGRIAYCCVMGNSGLHTGLGVFVGDRGFKTYLDTIDDSQLKNAKVMFERLAGFEDIHLTFTEDGNTDFWCQHPHQAPSPDNFTDAERTVMCQALEACISLSQLIDANDGDVVSVGFDEYEEYPTKDGGKEAPLLTNNGDSWTCTLTKLPAYDKSDERWVEGLADEAIQTDVVTRRLGSLSGLRKVGTLQCRLIHCPARIGDKEEGDGYYAHMLLAVKQSDGSVLKPEMERLANDDGAQVILLNFIDSLLEEGRLPLQISVPDELTECFLRTFCRQMGIKLARERRPLRELNEMWESLFRHFSSDNGDDEGENGYTPYHLFPMGTA